MKITIVGGGNIGTQFAVHCAKKGHEVTVMTSKPEIFSKRLTIVDENGALTHEGEICQATNDPTVGYSDADFIMVTLPANMMKRCADEVYKYARSAAIIGVVPGSGGSERVFHQSIERGNTFFLIERVPAIARLVEKGKCVKSTGYRGELHISSLPSAKAQECCELIEGIFDIPCISIPGILNLTMTPSNPILHTTRMRTIFADYREGVVYDRIPLFYEDWDDESSKLLLACDEEVQEICRVLPGLQYVKSLRDHYESQTAEEMTRKLSNIPAFKGIGTPSVKVDGGFIPDLHSRYFTADFSFGLSIIQQIGAFAGVKTPNIDETMEWYKKIAVETECFRYSDYGITSLEEFLEFYQR